ncbi:restriction endonuclease [Nonomuraea sp. NPDC050783]|uniref:restriction endonuclease n=1 Tax=Nonomuraea sp. NPDC050783 TaxID=3154634 RepID=UPI003467A86B
MDWNENSVWRSLFTALDGLPANVSNAEKQRRGNRFEHVLYIMFDAADMDPRTRYRPQGEEIDGSFLHRGRPMLFEAKWTSDPVPASSLYQFRGKVDGKLTGTIGLFISMAGYSDDAVDALVAGKTLNLILFDGFDMRKIAQPNGIRINQAIDIKLRAAAEEGTPYIPLPDIISAPITTSQRKVTVIVEGKVDAHIISTLARLRYPEKAVSVIPAMGRLNLPLVARVQLNQPSDLKELIIVADGDGLPEEARRNLERVVSDADASQELQITLVVVNPDLGAALGLRQPEEHLRVDRQKFEKDLLELNLRRLAASNPELKRLFSAMKILEE